MLNKESAKKILRSAGFYVSAEDPDVGGVTMKSVNGRDIFVNYFDFLSNPADHWGASRGVPAGAPRAAGHRNKGRAGRGCPGPRLTLT